MADDLMDTLDAAAFCADHTEWQTAIRSASEEIVRLRTALSTAAGMLSTYVVVGDSHPETMLNKLLAEADKAIAKEANDE